MHGDAAADSSRPATSRCWLLLLGGLWLLVSVWLVAGVADGVATLRLPDSDDNLRLLQVRDWIAGPDWFDLRQHRLAPAGGADIHWTRLVDLPLAGVILLLRPLVGAGAAEMAAVVLVPLITLFAAMLLVALIARRLIAPESWAFAAAVLLMASPAVGMMTPLRIDHHGWQIVLLLAMLLGLVIPRRIAGGALAGLAVAASLAIGVEMLPYLALGILLAVLGWIADPAETPRLRAFTATLGLATMFALAVFVPPGARFAFGCDALSASYAGPLLLGAALLFAASWLPLARRAARLGAALIAGGAAVVLLLAASPLCVIDPYHAVDPDARRLWLDTVSEALPLTRQGANAALATLVLPLIGLGGAIMMIRRTGDDAAARRGWMLIAVVSAFSLLLALVQTRAAVTAQALAAPGAAALLHFGWLRLNAHPRMLVRVFGSVALFLAASGLLPRLAINAATAERRGPADERRDRINARCLDPRAMAALDRLPPSILFADIDVTTPLIVHTHHRGLAGPYHRNGRVIADVMRAWAGTPAEAREVLSRYDVAYAVTCGMDAAARNDIDRAPGGFHARLLRGAPPPWLMPVALPGTPWRVWRLLPGPEISSGDLPPGRGAE